MKAVYEVNIHNEYNHESIWDLRDKYVKWFRTQKEAIAYARSIKKELKEICKDMDNIICLDVNKYYIDKEELNEEFWGIVYSLNIVGKY